MTARSAGKKILVFLMGSRGDVQPFIVLCKRLKEVGFQVRCLANPDHVDFIKCEGLEVIANGPNCEEVVTKDPELQASMAKGDFAKYLSFLDKKMMEFFPEALATKVRVIEEWRPDLLVAGPIESMEAACLAQAYGIPFIFAGLTLYYPSSYQTTAVNEPSWFPHLFMGLLTSKMWSDNQLHKMPELVKQVPKISEICDVSLRAQLLTIFHPPAPHLIGFSRCLSTLQPDWSEDVKQRAKITGWWALTREEDEKRFRDGSAYFGGDEKERLDAFLAGGAPPVYMGWGSMVSVSREHMACLAVRALMEAGLRGVVLRGWAGLGAEALAGQGDSEALAAYAKEHVLFLKTAPQQWLFPRCSAVVHHGGAGTTAASVRSGTPTIITPIFLDQYHHARIVSEHGIGVGTEQFAKVTVKALAGALRKCTTDQAIIGKAREVGERVMAEDGVGNAVRVLDDFLADEVDTGKFQKAMKKHLRKIEKIKENPPGCCFWFDRLCCNAKPNEYDVVVD